MITAWMDNGPPAGIDPGATAMQPLISKLSMKTYIEIEILEDVEMPTASLLGEWSFIDGIADD